MPSMSRSIGTELPDELLQAILIRLDDSTMGWRYERTSKRGLTSCSLTCRYWARHVRPLLFTHLTLRSREDEVQLRDFLATPDFLGRGIEDSMRYLTLIYDGAASGVPWTVLRPMQPAIPPHVRVRVEWRMVGEEDHSEQKRPTYLLTRVLPRTLPPSTLQHITRLTLCNLAIPIRGFLRFLRFIHFERLDMEKVTFVEGEDLVLLEALPALPLRVSNCWPIECSIHFRGLSKSALLYWTTVGRLALSGQVPLMNDTRVPTSISSRLFICTGTHDAKHATYNLAIISTERWPRRRTRLSYNCHYHLSDSRGILAAITEGTCNRGHPRTTVAITFTQLRCPELKDDARGFVAIDRLCRTLGDIETADTASVAIVCSSAEDKHTLLCGILQKRVLADPRDRYVHLQTHFWGTCGYAVCDILKAGPVEVALHNQTTPSLITTQAAQLRYFPENGEMSLTGLRELWEAVDEFREGTGA